MNKVFIDQECNLCTSYGKWISEKNKNLDISYQNDLSPEEIKLELQKQGIKVTGSSTRLLRDIYLYSQTSGIQIKHET